MAGRLEANLEEELKKELVKPEFMEKPASEWTDEEQKAAKEFEKKEQRVILLLHAFIAIFFPSGRVLLIREVFGSNPDGVILNTLKMVSITSLLDHSA